MRYASASAAATAALLHCRSDRARRLFGRRGGNGRSVDIDDGGGDPDGGAHSRRAVPADTATKLVADDGDSGDVFGVSVGMSGDGTAACVGASEDEDSNGERAGAAYVFSI